MSYYHDFSIGFNWWYIVAPIMLGAMFWVGTNRYWLSRRNEIRQHFNDRFITMLSVASTIIFTIMVFYESLDGVVQYLDNIGGNDSPAYNPLIAVYGIIFFGSTFYGALTYAMAIMGSAFSRNKVADRRRAKRLQDAATKQEQEPTLDELERALEAFASK